MRDRPGLVIITRWVARPRPFAPRRLPAGFLGMIALVAIGELVVSSLHTKLTTVWADDWRRTAQATATEARGRDVLAYGDSLVKFGVLPRVIEATTGLRAYNLAINAGTLPSQYFLLRRTLESGVRPGAIVADFCPLMIADDPRGSIRVYPELMTARDLIDLTQTTRDLEFAGAMALGWLLPTLRCRHEIRDDLAEWVGWRLDGVSPGRNVAIARGAWRKHLGAQPMPRPAVPPPTDFAMLAGLTPAAWAVDAINARYLDRFLTLAERHGIPVFWVVPPLAPLVEAGRQAQGTAAAYTEFARSVQERYPSVVVIDARSSGYDASVHIDLLHLSDRGAQILSADLARVVADHLAGQTSEHWVDLPPLGDRAVAAGADLGRATR